MRLRGEKPFADFETEVYMQTDNIHSNNAFSLRLGNVANPFYNPMT